MKEHLTNRQQIIVETFQYAIGRHINGQQVTSKILQQELGVTSCLGDYVVFMMKNYELFGQTFEAVSGTRIKPQDDQYVRQDIFQGQLAQEQMIKANVQLKKQTQKFTDINRIERKSFREYARVQNALTQYAQKLVNILENYSIDNFIDDFKYSQMSSDGSAIGIVQLTDLHLNQLVEQVYNKYDYEIASKRLKKLAGKTKQYFNSAGITKILIAMTGDMINSDRRLDQMLSMSTNRSNATFLAVYLIQQFIYDLLDQFETVHIAAVCGNESRLAKDVNFASRAISDNYDSVIYNMLKYQLGNKSQRIVFMQGQDWNQMIININSKNILLTHGHQNKFRGNMQDGIQSIVGKHAANNVIVDYVICGHIHACMISDTFARGASLVGANAYSHSGLQLASRASQNIFIVNKDGIEAIRIDLQQCDGIEGYQIYKELCSYNAKSASKLHNGSTILTIVI